MHENYVVQAAQCATAVVIFAHTCNEATTRQRTIPAAAML